MRFFLILSLLLLPFEKHEGRQVNFSLTKKTTVSFSIKGHGYGKSYILLRYPNGKGYSIGKRDTRGLEEGEYYAEYVPDYNAGTSAYTDEIRVEIHDK